jgi:hypothetical protein
MAELSSGMAWKSFLSLVSGLSPEARFADAYANKPKRITAPEQLIALTGRYLGGDQE